MPPLRKLCGLLTLAVLAQERVSVPYDLSAVESAVYADTDELLQEAYFDDHVGNQIRSPLLDAVGKESNRPLLSELWWLPESLSLSHALISCVFYGILIAKVRRDGSVFGISIQTILAMCVTEVLMGSETLCRSQCRPQLLFSYSVQTTVVVVSFHRRSEYGFVNRSSDVRPAIPAVVRRAVRYLGP